MEEQEQLYTQFKEEKEEQFKDHYIKRNWLTKFYFNWLNPFINHAIKNNVEQEDIFQVNESEKSQSMYRKFERYFTATTLLSRWIFFKIFILAFKYEWTILLILRCLEILLALYNPILFKKMISMFDVERPNFNLYLTNISYFVAWLLGYYGFQIILDFYENWFKAKVENTLSAKVYNHLFKATYPLQPSGELVNLIQIDSVQITTLIHDGITVLTIPYNVGGAVLVYYNLIGDSALIGVIGASLNLVISVIYGKWYASYQRKIMKSRDQRVKGIQELLVGINTIKQNGYYQYFEDKIKIKRQNEMNAIRNQSILTYLMNFIFQAIRVSVLLTTFRFYFDFSLKNILLINTSYRQLSSAVNTIPGTLSKCLYALTSIDRVCHFIAYYGEQREQVMLDTSSIVIANGNFRWHKKHRKDAGQQKQQHQVGIQDEEGYLLKDINISIQKGETILIVGNNGSGKSSLLYSILGELEKSDLTLIKVDGRISIAVQEPWIIQGSLKQNIILDEEDMNIKRFMETLEISQLLFDLESMPRGFNSDIGERGQTLSGGQRKRLHLARALYQDCDVYMLDNPCSALDSKTAKKLSQAIKQKLGNKTLIVASNSIEHWEFANRVIYLDQGKILYQGDVNQFIQSQYYTSLDKIQNDEDQLPQIESDQANLDTSNHMTLYYQYNLEPNRMISIEDRVRGRVNSGVFVQIYYLFGQYWVFILVGLLSFASMYSLIYLNLEQTRITKITDDKKRPQEEKDAAVHYYLWLYPICVMGNSALTQINGIFLTFRGVYASLRLHSTITANLLQGSVQYFYNLILGSRILNRLTNDIYQFDMNTQKQIAYIFSQTFSFGSMITTYFASASYTSYPFVVIYIILQVYYAVCYIRVNLEVARIQAISKTPILNNLQETASGITYLKNSDKSEQCISKFYSQLDLYQRNCICSAALSSWYLQKQLFIVLFLNFGIITFNYYDTHLSKQAATLCIYLSLNFGDSFKAILNTVQLFYNNSIHIERCLFLVDQVPREEQQQQQQQQQQQHEQQIQVPQQYNINNSDYTDALQLQNIFIKYRDDFNFVVKDVSFNLQQKQKLAIIGRTGCGKTCLMQCITRLINPYQGNINYFGQNYQSQSIQNIRSLFSVVSQDPFTYEGTVKQNLDPLNEFTEEQIQNSLRDNNLNTTQIFNNLHFKINHLGSNLSLGEKQLIVLMRTLLQNRQVVILDECTGNLDIEYAKLINEILEKFMQNKSVIGITHKFDQLNLFDSVILISSGKILSQGSREQVLKQYRIQE